MKMDYDKATDTLTVHLYKNAEAVEIKPVAENVLGHYEKNGVLVALEIRESGSNPFTGQLDMLLLQTA